MLHKSHAAFVLILQTGVSVDCTSQVFSDNTSGVSFHSVDTTAKSDMPSLTVTVLQ